MSERDIQEIRDDVRRATMMAQENRQAIAAMDHENEVLRDRVKSNENDLLEMRKLIGGLK